MKTRPADGLHPLSAPRDGLPAWCDAALHDPTEGEFFASRLWYDLLLAQAIPTGSAPLLAVAGEAMLPLATTAGGLCSLSGPYSLDWRPLASPSADAAALRRAGAGLAGLLRLRPPLRLEALDPAAPGLAALLAGLRSRGMATLTYRHFGNWHEVLPPGLGWEAYLAGRPPALRTTIRRKLARCLRDMAFEQFELPGPALEAGIAAYEAVRAGSWKPEEPFPAFDAALMRATAAIGLLRLGILRARADGQPIAAQYWVLDRGRRRATVLKLSHLESHRAASPGTALTALMIERLLAEERIAELDFGRGDDPYKQLWVGTRRQRIGVVVASPLHPAGLAAIARHVAGSLRRRVQRASARQPVVANAAAA